MKKYNKALTFCTGAGIIIAFAFVLSMAYLMPAMLEQMLLFVIITLVVLLLSFVSLLGLTI